MNLKASLGGRLKGHAEEAELNLTAIMNIFLILIPFLLLTAVFVQISVLELSLPSISDSQSQQAGAKKAESTVINILEIKEDGLKLTSPNIKFSTLAKTNNQYDFSGLQTQLKRIKDKYPGSDDIIIQPELTIKYDTIVQIMDNCRSAGFPLVSISG